MDFRFTRDEEAFRQEVRRFLEEHLPPGWDGSAHEHIEDSDDFWGFSRDFTKRLATRGWVCPHWPKKYGGAGMTVMEQLVFNEEMAYSRAPRINVNGVSMIGPILIRFGSDEQRRHHLPGIAEGEVIWCQGYSEPGTGSDLASLQTRAVRDGDDYLVTGQKIWTSWGHRADRMFLLARTDESAPKHRGLTLFVADMHAPGVTVQPIVNMAGYHAFNQVFLDDVRIPASDIVGDINQGWYVGAALLDFERSNISSAASERRMLDDLIQYCHQASHSPQHLANSHHVRNLIADRWIEVEAGRYISYRVASMQNQGLIPSVEASVAKLYHSEVGQRVANTGLQIMGLSGQLQLGTRWTNLHAQFARHYLATVASTIAGGSSEIQRNIIASRGLGLPRA